jgi:hypothetical protein
MNKKISSVQTKLIHIAKSQLKLTDAQYRSLLRLRCNGKESSKELTYEEADRLIDHFKRLGFKVRPKRSTCSYMCEPRKRREPLPANVIVLVSPGQIAKIERLKESIHWGARNGFDLWLKKYFNIDGIKGIKYSTEAHGVIEGLKGLWKSQNKCSCTLAKGIAVEVEKMRR